ncbi:hypothetical protein V5F41_03290 [Xanthobacter autotrophicus]|uniref:hypothetical protein n=1 Tax=Xanthobacter autotrophicus TaxID=280 RepID=UPI00372BB5A3
MSHAEFFASLFKFATGWLGWPPAVALATPIPQIEAAMEGRVEMLKAIFGSSEKPASNVPLGTKFQAAFSLKGTRRVERKNT